MEKKEFPIMNDKDIQSSSIFQKTYNNIKNSLNNYQNIEYKGLKSIILNFIEQNITGFHLKNKNITQDKLFLLFIIQLSSDGILQNNLLMKLIINKDVTNIKEMDSLFNFVINKQTTSNENNEKYLNKKIKKEERFQLSITAENDYQQLLYNYPELCENIKQITIQILNSLSFSGNKKPTSSIKFKNFINSFLQNQKLTRLIKNKLQLEFDNVSLIITEGIIIDFIRIGIIFFPSENKITYNLNTIEKEKFRLSQNSKNQNNINSDLSEI